MPLTPLLNRLRQRVGWIASSLALSLNLVVLVVVLVSFMNVDLLASLQSRAPVSREPRIESCLDGQCWVTESFDALLAEALGDSGTWALSFTPSERVTKIYRRDGFQRVVRAGSVYSDVDGLIGDDPPHEIRICLQFDGLVDCESLEMIHLDYDAAENYIAIVVALSRSSGASAWSRLGGVARGESGGRFALAGGVLEILLDGRE